MRPAPRHRVGPRIFIRYHRPGIHVFYGYFPRTRSRHYHHHHHHHYVPERQVIVVEPEQGALPPLSCPAQSSPQQNDTEQWCTTARGTRHGPYLRWHVNGHIAAEGYFESGQKHGVWTEWYDTGQVTAEGQFENGERTATWVYWNQDGEQISVSNYP
ncbi:MAG: hypothetical protein H0U74_19685 [Bradymonadaceae bacterium]|nr:hypothetical protein [Lujinxingiaceae bacterium]